jgi:hypothetical protein
MSSVLLIATSSCRTCTSSVQARAGRVAAGDCQGSCESSFTLSVGIGRLANNMRMDAGRKGVWRIMIPLMRITMYVG